MKSYLIKVKYLDKSKNKYFWVLVSLAIDFNLIIKDASFVRSDFPLFAKEKIKENDKSKMRI